MNEEALRKEREKLAELRKKQEEIQKTEEKINHQYHHKNQGNKKNNVSIPLIILVSLISFLGGLSGTYLTLKYFHKSAGTITKKTVELTETNSISEAVEKIFDSVVVVEGYKDEKLISTGTGFAYKQEKNEIYIMTNNHVISGSETVKLILSDNSEVEAEIVGADTYSDIAVLKIKKTAKITVAETGNNEKTKLGDTVFTLGSPQGSEYAGTVTKGILSGKDRLVEVSYSNSQTSDYFMNVIQTDAAINPGNSGGPLCNSNGEVIGITNMKLVDDSVEGMGFAIPIEDAIHYANLLEEEGKVTRPYLGISMLDITTNSYYLWRENITIPKEIEKGVVVYSIEEDSPASKVDLKKGDIILKIANEEITSLAKFRYSLYKHQAGEEIELTILRNDKKQTIKIKLGTSE